MNNVSLCLNYDLSDANLMVSDDCLAPKGGKKRKMSQVTLLQLNFSRSKVIPNEPDGMSTDDAIRNLNGLDESDDYAKDGSAYLENNSNANPEEHFISEGTAGDEFAPPLLPSDVEEGREDGTYETLDDYDMSKVVIPTLIVGRRYGSRKSIDPQSRICLSRDPENVKDRNAIKV